MPAPGSSARNDRGGSMPSEEHERKVDFIVREATRRGLTSLGPRALRRNGFKKPDAVLALHEDDGTDESRWLVVEVGGLSQECIDVFRHTTLLWVPKDGDLVGLWSRGVAVPCGNAQEALDAV